MPETALRSRPAIAHAPLGAPGGTLALEALPEGRLVQALAPPAADAASVSARLAAIADGAPFAVRPYAPGQWFVVSDAPLAPGELARLGARVGADVALSDQSHGRVRLALEGRPARHVLARGTGVDLAPASFPLGSSAQTLFGHVGIHLTRVAEDRFELIVLRSLAESLWEELAEAGGQDFAKRPAR